MDTHGYIMVQPWLIIVLMHLCLIKDNGDWQRLIVMMTNRVHHHVLATNRPTDRPTDRQATTIAKSSGFYPLQAWSFIIRWIAVACLDALDAHELVYQPSFLI